MKTKIDKTTCKKQEDITSTSLVSNFWAILLVGGLLRACLYMAGLHEVLQRRIEIVNPITSWFRVKECIALSKLNISPYSGDICHQPPLMVAFLQLIPKEYVGVTCILVDVVTAALLYKFARIFLELKVIEEENEKSTYAKGVECLTFSENVGTIPETVMAVYLFCPFTIANCLSFSTNVFNHFIIAMTLLLMARGWIFLSCVCVALLTYLSLYPILLLLSPVLVVCKTGKLLQKASKVLQCVGCFTLALFVLLKVSAELHHSWDFVSAVYGFTLRAPDLTPNMGLFWYFFLEVFDHFRFFFLCIYQINAFVYALPVAITFRKHPYFVFYIMLSLIALFKSYSNVGDLAVPLSILPLWSIVYRYMRNSLLVGCMLFFASMLAPLMWQIWIYSGAGNANFFYAVTLLYNTAQIFLLSDVLYGFLRRNFHLHFGLSPDESEKGIVVLQ